MRIRALTMISLPCAVLAAHELAPAHFVRPAPTRSAHGRVLQVGSSIPVSRVMVIATGKGLAVPTSASGRFELHGIPAGATQLVFRHPCYFPVQVTIPPDGDVAVSIGLPYDATAAQRPGCGGLGARGPDSDSTRTP